MPSIIKQSLAEQDLIDIWLYSWQYWGEQQADDYLDALEKVFHLLAEQPKLGLTKTWSNSRVNTKV